MVFRFADIFVGIPGNRNLWLVKRCGWTTHSECINFSTPGKCLGRHTLLLHRRGKTTHMSAPPSIHTENELRDYYTASQFGDLHMSCYRLSQEGSRLWYSSEANSDFAEAMLPGMIGPFLEQYDLNVPKRLIAFTSVP